MAHIRDPCCFQGDSGRDGQQRGPKGETGDIGPMVSFLDALCRGPGTDRTRARPQPQRPREGSLRLRMREGGREQRAPRGHLCVRVWEVSTGDRSNPPRGTSLWNGGPLDVYGKRWSRQRRLQAGVRLGPRAPQSVPPPCTTPPPAVPPQCCSAGPSFLQLRVSRFFSFPLQGLPGRDGVPGGPGEPGKNVSAWNGFGAGLCLTLASVP